MLDPTATSLTGTSTSSEEMESASRTILALNARHEMTAAGTQ